MAKSKPQDAPVKATRRAPAKAKPQKPQRRPPVTYSPALGEAVCAHIAEGLSLREISLKEGMPQRTAIFAWIQAHTEFESAYRRAKEIQAEVMAEEIMEIADDSTNDWRQRQVREGWEVREIDQEAINRSRLRVDARKWLMAKMLPKKYGDTVGLEHSGGIDMGLKGLLEAIDGKTRGLPGK